MQKDVIYIDVEDDITAIIGKVKASKEKVVALVPPKRVGVLQSAVNLRLLNRAAQQGDKKLALVTSNSALIALAAAASIPVAKNLQSKPEMADVPAVAVDDDEDIIEGSSLPVGEHAKQAEVPTGEAASAATMTATLAEAPQSDAAPLKPKVKKGSKVPNFNKFRKRLVLIAAGLIALIIFIIWATVIAPRATVVLSAKTASTSVNQPLTFSTKADTSLDKNTVKAISQSQSADKSVDFQATGKKDAGQKATGTVQFSTNDAGTAINGVTIPAGTKLTDSNGNVFLTDNSVTLNSSNFSGASTTMTAAENGSKYNAATGSMSGAPDKVSADIQGSTSGGVTKMVTVVTSDDVQKAEQKLANENIDSVKSALKAKFASGTTVIDQSFDTSYNNVKVQPAIGQEADSATVSVTAVYTLYGVSKDEVSAYLDAYLKKSLSGSPDQRVYKNGSDSFSIQDPTKIPGGAKATLIATAQVGPNINDNKVKQEVEGKKFGDIQQQLESIQGVQNVGVKFFPFWVNTVPNDPSRITIEFKLDESK